MVKPPGFKKLKEANDHASRGTGANYTLGLRSYVGKGLATEMLDAVIQDAESQMAEIKRRVIQQEERRYRQERAVGRQGT